MIHSANLKMELIYFYLNFYQFPKYIKHMHIKYNTLKNKWL